MRLLGGVAAAEEEDLAGELLADLPGQVCRAVAAVEAADVRVGLLVRGSSIPPTPTSLPPGSNPGVPVTKASQPGSVVVYEIVGKGSASTVTYTKQDFSQDQLATAQLPFRKELRFDERVGAPLSLTGQNSSRGGAITCRITVDGTVVDESASTGAYTVVTCRGNG